LLLTASPDKPGVPYVRAAIYRYIMSINTENIATVTGPFMPRSEYVDGLARVEGPRTEIGKLIVSDRTKFNTEPATKADARCDGR